VGYVDFILNLAGLLLWLNWRSVRFDPLEKRTPATLMGTLRPAEPKKLRRWHLLVFIVGLLLLRALIYRWIGGMTSWTGQLNLQVVVLSFRSDLLDRITLFSFLSFGLALVVFYVVLLFLSLLKGPDPIHRLIKIPLGRLDEWPVWAKMLLPLVWGAVVWWSLSWWLDWLQISLPPVSVAHRIEQALVVGLASYQAWEYPFVVLLLLHLLSSYIYFGRHPVWNYVDQTARKLLRPLKRIPLRAGRFDFAPLLGLALVFLAAQLFEHGLNWLYTRLPF
jgi:uncharacterized protein YggT (Ycf19 family)